jgi:hypothetical protein
MMSRSRFTLFALPLLLGCGDQAAQHPIPVFPTEVPLAPAPELAPIPQRVALVEARQGFNTKLIQRVSAGQPLPEPPPNLLQMIEFESAVGKLGGLQYRVHDGGTR